ncbi:MAG TPA: hydrogenase nickel incorporation protein HypA [Thermoprotei archaeon]|nr:hydrogenase nickel incorporation protein HypA [Thermoprotei archaeon]
MVHEWALAEAIVEYVKSNYPNVNKFRRIEILLGELQSIDEEILGFSLKEILNSEKIAVDELVLSEEEAVLRCRRCRHEWRLKELKLEDEVKEAIHFVPEVVHSFIKCPKCGSRDFEVVRGRGVYVKEVIPYE